jgi:hypothetical protein
MVRMKQESFFAILEKIENHAVFQNASRHVQEKVWVQLVVALNRLGCYGNGISIGRVARFAGLSNGTVWNYTKRVIVALLSLTPEYISWPDANERRKIAAKFYHKHGLKHCVGVVDGTPVIFTQRPAVDGETFYDRKGRYSINLQLMCDDRRRIIYYVVGYPGSMYDGDVLSQSPIYATPTEYFSDMQYIVADAGYGAKWWLCTPYKNPQAQLEHNRIFNQLFSSGRVTIEHTNGILKNRFASLKGLPHQVKQKKHFKGMMELILATLTLHNMLLILSDEWEEEEEPEQDEEPADYHADLLLHADADGNHLRLRVQTDIINWNYSRNTSLP